MNETEWVSIPGYSNYQINKKTLSVRNLATCKELMIRKGMVCLIGSKNVCINIPRLLFCATRKVNPIDVPRDVLIIMEDGCPVAYDRREYMSNKTKSIYIEKRQSSPIEKYLEARAFIDLAINAMEKQDYSKVVENLYTHQSHLIASVRRNRVAVKKNEAEEIVSEAINRTLKNIMSGSLVFAPFQYIYRVAKGIAAEMNEARRLSARCVRSNPNYRSYDKR